MKENDPSTYDPQTKETTMTELLYDPDSELSDDDFRRYFPDSGDLPEHSFSDDDLAFRYSKLYSRCVYDVDSMTCIFCHRSDH